MRMSALAMVYLNHTQELGGEVGDHLVHEQTVICQKRRRNFLAATNCGLFTDTFAGSDPSDVPLFIVAQIAGALYATFLFRWLVRTWRVCRPGICASFRCSRFTVNVPILAPKKKAECQSALRQKITNG